MEKTIFDILLDKNNHDDIVMKNTDGQDIKFAQKAVIPYFVDGYIRTEWGNFIMVCVACTISNIFIMYLLGCSKGEKQFFRGKLMNVFARRFI